MNKENLVKRITEIIEEVNEHHTNLLRNGRVEDAELLLANAQYLAHHADVLFRMLDEEKKQHAKETRESMPIVAAPTPVTEKRTEQKIVEVPHPKPAEVDLPKYVPPPANAEVKQPGHTVHGKIAPEKVQQPTLHDQLSKSKQAEKSRADHLKHTHEGELGTLLSLNQKFLFTKELFKGDNEIFSTTLAYISSLSSFVDAEHYLRSNFSEKNGWSRKEEVVDEFLKMLMRKFEK